MGARSRIKRSRSQARKFIEGLRTDEARVDATQVFHQHGILNKKAAQELLAGLGITVAPPAKP